ncbi:hypothetical protein KIN20_029952 [Parelaphostrongylus tenuis]|uniref:Suppressor of white apricot N-terminal domain-containing protein n=1 Tax=Parelaphostrongylus tenuis TaxID=148309 RepID=A0AAD5R324_PARTN|nr:hypothetical protein KIN20_029952 [Parelaphostrongylus tenuis]
MQLHGRKCIIHTDRSIAKAAEDKNILHRWQGDPSVLIDRFDVRAHLDMIPPVKKKTLEPDSEDEKLELICDFERYRVLIINEFRDVSEKDYLRKIAEKEFWRIPKDETTQKETEDVEISDDETDIEQPEDIDVELDLRGADAESQRRVNCIGEAYGVRRGSFAGLLKADAVARAETAELRRIDREKSSSRCPFTTPVINHQSSADEGQNRNEAKESYSLTFQITDRRAAEWLVVSCGTHGRDSKHERLLLKKQRALIVGKGCPDEATVSLLSFVEKSAALKRSLIVSSSSSESEDDARPQFITTFGGDERKG